MLTNQALLISIAFIIIAIVFIMNVILPSKSTKSDKMILLTILFVVIIPLMFLKVYMVQCMIHGNCTLLTWILAYIAIILAFVYLLFFIRKMLKKKEELDYLIQIS